MDERVQKILSQWGIASRRQIEHMIREGRVSVNNAAAHLGQKVDPDQDVIEIDGIVVKSSDRPEQLYLLMNKPLGVVSTCHDPQGRRTVLDLLPPEWQQGQGIHPVGRLDVDSSGALLLTNDGNLTFYLTHPRHHIPKTYQVWVEGYPSEQAIHQWRQGILLDNQITLPAEVIIIRRHSNHKTLVKVVLREGRNRQIRRVSDHLGHPVLALHRTAIGSIQLQAETGKELPRGGYRSLTSVEICFLKSQLDLTSEREPVKNGECNV